MDEKLKAGLNGQKEDFDFHLAIAKASGNHYFTRFIEFIGSGVIPARELITKNDKEQQQASFFDTISQEHRQITLAIANKDIKAARKAVSLHLGQSKERHAKIVKGKNQ
jgi:DNA-binding FadR family transcriptional regulator